MPDQAGPGGVFIIAEGGVNHNGDISLAHRLVDAAAQAGADAIKFQTFSADAVVTPDAPLAEYQTRAQSGTQLDMIRALELPLPAHHELKAHAEELGIVFMSTAFDMASLRFLVEELQVPRIKIPSGELTNTPYVMACARYGLPMILSTGMATLAEVVRACEAISFALNSSADPARIEDVVGALDVDDHRAQLAERLTLLHCTTSYPAPIDEVNLRAMVTMREVIGMPVGYSDHTIGTQVCVAATALGATVLEKHLTVDRTLPGPDHLASTEPEEFASLVSQVRDVTRALGDGIKAPCAAEIPNIPIARRNLVAARPIRRGDILGPDDIAALRHGAGMAPDQYWTLLGSTAARDYRAFEPFDEPNLP